MRDTHGMVSGPFWRIESSNPFTDAKIPFIRKTNVKDFKIGSYSVPDTPILVKERTQAIIGY